MTIRVQWIKKSRWDILRSHSLIQLPAVEKRALPIEVFASMDGNLLNVEMIFTLPSGVGASKDTVKGYLCGGLNQ